MTIASQAYTTTFSRIIVTGPQDVQLALFIWRFIISNIMTSNKPSLQSLSIFKYCLSSVRTFNMVLIYVESTETNI